MGSSPPSTNSPRIPHREAKKPGEAAASVEHAGRLFEGWVHRRQQLADVPWKKRQDGPGGI